jgi:cell division septation protein DedD
MRSRLLPLLFLSFAATASAAPTTADPDDGCGARADAIAAQLVAKAAQPLSEREIELARSAALAGCRDESGSEPTPAPAPEPTSTAAETSTTSAEAAAKEEPSATERFWAGLLSFENKDMKKRAGKYRYVEKED